MIGLWLLDDSAGGLEEIGTCACAYHDHGAWAEDEDRWVYFGFLRVDGFHVDEIQWWTGVIDISVVTYY